MQQSKQDVEARIEEEQALRKTTTQSLAALRAEINSLMQSREETEADRAQLVQEKISASTALAEALQATSVCERELRKEMSAAEAAARQREALERELSTVTHVGVLPTLLPSSPMLLLPRRVFAGDSTITHEDSLLPQRMKNINSPLFV
jgi:chromosome segregation ATPase